MEGRNTSKKNIWLENRTYFQSFAIQQKYFSLSCFGHILWKAQAVSNGKGQKILLYLKGTFFLAILNIHPHKSKSKTDKYLFSVKQNIISPALNVSDFEVSNQSEGFEEKEILREKNLDHQTWTRLW